MNDSKWIDSKTALPLETGRYLVWWQNKEWRLNKDKFYGRNEFAIMTYLHRSGFWRYQTSDHYGMIPDSGHCWDDVPIQDVLFWMPLPFSPIGEKERGYKGS